MMPPPPFTRYRQVRHKCNIENNGNNGSRVFLEIFFAGVKYNHHNSKMSFFDVMNNVKPYRRKPKRVFCSKCQKPFSEIRYLRQHVNQVHVNLDSIEKQAIFNDCASKVRKMTPKPVKENSHNTFLVVKVTAIDRVVGITYRQQRIALQSAWREI